jgi:hypothetical protein
MLTPKEWAIADEETADRLGLEGEHGLLFCVDEHGERWTAACDPNFVRMLADAPAELRADLETPAETFPSKRVGWPDDWQ